MAIPIPTQGNYNAKRDTSTLHFVDEDGKAYSNEYVMRGGICFPMSIRAGNRETIEGYAVVVGRDIRSGVHTVCKETKVLAIDHITDGDGRIKYRGVAPWFNDAWATYFCRWYHWHGRTGSLDHWLRDIKRSAMVQPKPKLSECIWDDAAEVDHAMSLLALHGKLKADKDGGFMQQMAAYQTNQAVPYPARIAVMACLAGFHQYAWTRASVEYD